MSTRGWLVDGEIFKRGTHNADTIIETTQIPTDFTVPINFISLVEVVKFLTSRYNTMPLTCLLFVTFQGNIVTRMRPAPVYLKRYE